MDERVKTILERLVEAGDTLFEASAYSNYACRICGGYKEHTIDCVVTLAQQVLDDEKSRPFWHVFTTSYSGVKDA